MTDNAELRRSLFNPYWVSDPAAWQAPAEGAVSAGSVGIYHFALAGNVGLFNLSWLMLDLDEPPTAAVYAERRPQLWWVIYYAPNIHCKGQTLERVASFNTLAMFEVTLAAWLRAASSTVSPYLLRLHQNAMNKLYGKNLHA